MPIKVLLGGPWISDRSREGQSPWEGIDGEMNRNLRGCDEGLMSMPHAATKSDT
jgi:hypothetical protein